MFAILPLEFVYDSFMVLQWLTMSESPDMVLK